ncbi:Hypothetical protein A7982_06748 [Minicystis rosea]|nr:Hypothetical protein A7982_06748 [Minicystis rosea]
MHCSILGTCLSLGDLHVIARKARWQLNPSASAYQVHSWFVDYAASANHLSKLVDKELEKRHGSAARVIRRARTEEEIEVRWKEVAAGGQIASAYWGAMSHPLCSSDLQWRLFGEIHMLSHLMGASRRSDLCRVHDLEVTCAALDGKLAQLKHDHRAVLKDRKRFEDDLASQRSELDRSVRRLTIARDRIAALESTTHASELETRIEALERRLVHAEARASAAESRLFETQTLLENARGAGASAAEQVRELSEENAALEAELTRSMLCPFAQGQDGEEEDLDGLCGKRILCVGGRSNLVQHYRALVERRGGELLHHDGGLEESLDAVTRAMSTVDAVICPIDCVSHAATLKVKRACKHLAKPFIVLRSSGLSSFARCIQAIACPPSPSNVVPTIGVKS